MIGETFGKLTVIYESDRKNHYVCKCDCGNVSTVLKYNLLKGNTKSCGCTRLTQNGLSKKYVAEHNVWRKLISRCNNKNDRSFNDYGGRGISVCGSWINSFEQFLSDMGQRPSSKHSIDRINNDGNYEPSNCRWATRKVQANNCRKNHVVTYRGEKYTIAQLAEATNIPRARLTLRINTLKWSVEDAVNRPLNSFLYPYNGQMLKLSEISKLTGIKRGTLYFRLHYAKQTPEEAFRANGHGRWPLNPER